MYYVYILRSLHYKEQIYIGLTNDVRKRLSDHNSGHSEHTAKYKPWNLEMYLVFKTKTKAAEFEKYLKSHSGRAFAFRRLL